MKKYLSVLYMFTSLYCFGAPVDSHARLLIERAQTFQIETEKTYEIYSKCAREISNRMSRDEEIGFDIQNFAEDFLEIKVLRGDIKLDLAVSDQDKNHEKLKELKGKLLNYRKELKI